MKHSNSLTGRGLICVFWLAMLMPGLEASANDEIKPMLILSGTDSSCSKPGFERCFSRSQLATAWRTHQALGEKEESSSHLSVDFTAYMVLIIFHGRSSLNRGIDIVEVIDEPLCVRVRYRPAWYQCAPAPDASEADLLRLETRSFAFIVLPRTSKAICFEEDTQSLISGPAIWKEKADLPAIVK